MNRRSFGKFLAGAALAAPQGVPFARLRAEEPLKVGFIYVGPVGDFGWSYAHDVSRKACEARFGAAIKTSFVESVPEGPDCEGVLEDMVAKGHKLIFSTSFGFMNYTLKVARKHPEVMFEHCTGYKRAPNVATYNIRFYEGRFVQGVIAGLTSKTGIAGYIGSLPIPEVVQGMNAFLIGMKSMNPAARLKFIPVNSWYDPPREADAAKALMDQGCDVIAQHTDSPAPLQAAAARGIKGFGEAVDMEKFAPSTQLTSNLNNWAPYCVKRIETALARSWSSTDTWGGFASGMLEMAPFKNVAPDVRDKAAAARDLISSGRNRIFTGPLTAQDGSVKVAAGATMDDQALSQMQWLLQGIEGKLS